MQCLKRLNVIAVLKGSLSMIRRIHIKKYPAISNIFYSLHIHLDRYPKPGLTGESIARVHVEAKSVLPIDAAPKKAQDQRNTNFQHRHE
jgi:hypothetical protein